MYDLAVIGFGATGVGLLRQLHSYIYEQDLGPISIALISPADSFSSGLAFGQAETFHKVNTPPELMGIDPEDPQGFASWMRKRVGMAERYPSRLTYSEYLKETYMALSLGNGDKLSVSEYQCFAIDIDMSNGYPVVILDDGREVCARRSVLTLGAVASPNFSKSSDLQPVPPSSIPHINTPPSALVAGTGLTAVDCVRSLMRKGCQAVHWFSRNSYAPTAISRQTVYEPLSFTWNNLKHELSQRRRGDRMDCIISLLRREMIHMRDPEVVNAEKFRMQNDLVGYWDYLLERADNSDLPFQDTLMSTRYYAHKIWQKLVDDECLAFQRNFGAFWACWRHPIPMEVVEELNRYAREGRLQLHRPVAPIKRQGKRYILETPTRIISADGLIDGTGGGGDMEVVDSPLIRNLLRRGLAIPHPCGGLRVDGLTYALKNYSQQSGIFCLGPLAKGSLFSTNAFWFNSLCSSNLARYLAIEMRLVSKEEACRQ